MIIRMLKNKQTNKKHNSPSKGNLLLFLVELKFSLEPLFHDDDVQFYFNLGDLAICMRT